MLNCKVKSERDRMLWKRKISRREYLSPALALRCVELQAQQSGSDHAEPVDVHHILGILAIMSKNTGTHADKGDGVNMVISSHTDPHPRTGGSSEGRNSEEILLRSYDFFP